jgi:chromosome partitioning protein
MRIWTIANQKGGVGKTTTTLALGSRLALRGFRVLLLDLDPHASMTQALGLAAEPPTPGVLELFDEPAQPIAGLRRSTPVEGLSLIAGQPGLATLERRAGQRPGLGRALGIALSEVAHAYDYALLDCPPTLGLLMVNALAAADRLIVPTQTEPLAQFGLQGIARTAAMVSRSRGRPLPISILPTLYDRRTRIATDTLNEMRTRFEAHVWDNAVPVDTRLRDIHHLLGPDGQDSQARGLPAYARALDWLLASDHLDAAGS